MLKLIPAAKKLEIKAGKLTKKAISFDKAGLDPRLVKALCKLPTAEDGTKLSVTLTGEAGEGYTLDVAENAVDFLTEWSTWLEQLILIVKGFFDRLMEAFNSAE